MSDYISRQAAIDALPKPQICEYMDEFGAGRNSCAYDAEKAIEDIPAADVAPVVHGKWIENSIPDSMLKMCSDCGFTCGAYSFNFCPNCGAKMDCKREERAG